MFAPTYQLKEPDSIADKAAEKFLIRYTQTMEKMPHFKAHLFICTNQRQGKECCAGRGSQQLRDQLKARIKQDPNLRHQVRVNNSGCLDQCSRGIAAVLYPEGKWFLHLTPEDDQKLFDEIQRAVKEAPNESSQA